VMSPAELERIISRAVADASPAAAAGSGAFASWRGLLSQYRRAWRARHAPRGLLPGRGGDSLALVRGGGRCGVLRGATAAEGVRHRSSAAAGIPPGSPSAHALLRAAGAGVADSADTICWHICALRTDCQPGAAFARKHWALRFMPCMAAHSDGSVTAVPLAFAEGLQQLVGGAALTAAQALVEAGVEPRASLLPALTEAIIAGPHGSSGDTTGGAG